MSCATANFFLILTTVLTFAVPVMFIIFLIKWIRKQPKKVIGYVTLVMLIGSIIFFFIGIINWHEYEEVSKISATCTADGETHKKCEKCGKEYTAKEKSFGHQWNFKDCETLPMCSACGVEGDKAKGHSWKKATCTTPKKCSECDKEEGTTAEHKWKEATCTNPKKCSVCLKEEGVAVEHKWKEATCDKPPKCSTCGKKEGEPLGHDWKSPLYSRKCKRCGKNKDKVIGHAWQEATCDKPKKCLKCNKSKGESLGHSWREATCTSAKTCLRCSETEGSALGHSKSIDPSVSQTCVLSGLTEGSHCSTCGIVLEEQKIIPASHSYIEEIVKAPTCTKNGEKIFSCSLCGESYAEEMMSNGHEWEPATCVKPKMCKKCGLTDGVKLGHSWNDWSYVSSKVCTRCGKAESKHSSNNKTEHSHSGVVYITPTGKRYHYSKGCAGKNAKSCSFSYAKRYYTPCRTCVL